MMQFIMWKGAKWVEKQGELEIEMKWERERNRDDYALGTK